MRLGGGASGTLELVRFPSDVFTTPPPPKAAEQTLKAAVGPDV